MEEEDAAADPAPEEEAMGAANSWKRCQDGVKELYARVVDSAMVLLKNDKLADGGWREGNCSGASSNSILWLVASGILLCRRFQPLY